MDRKIQVKRGNQVNLPQLDSGEMALAIDAKDVYIGTPTGNQLVGGNTVISQLGDATTIQNIPVDVTGLQDGHTLTYDLALGKFVGKLKPSGGGGSSVSDSGLSANSTYYSQTLYDSGILKA